MTERRAATLTIHHASDLTPEGRRQIAAWLRDQADQLDKDGDQYAKVFTAKYSWLSKDDEKEAA